MTNFSVGIFKRIFQAPSGLFELISQLWTGDSDSFNYKVPGDNTAKDSNNSLCSYSYSSFFASAQRDQINTTLWVNPSKTLSCAIASGWSTHLYDVLSDPVIPATHYHTYTLQTVVIGNKSYVATPSNDMDETTAGGIHIEDIAGTKYVVAYIITRTSTQVIRLSRYSTVYDESIDPSTITAFAELGTSTPDYFGEYTHDGAIYVATAIDQGNENIRYLPSQNRQLCVNRDGNKIIFFCRNYGTAYDSWVILEATDNGTTINITKHSVFTEPQTLVPGAGTSEVITGSQAKSAVSVSGSSTSTDSGSGTYSRTVDTDIQERKVFLGCAYSKYDDSVLILSRNEYTEKHDISNSQSYDCDHTGTNIGYPQSFNTGVGLDCFDTNSTVRRFIGNFQYDWDENSDVLCINDVPISPDNMKTTQTATGDTTATNTGPWPGTNVFEVSGTRSYKKSILLNYFISDLAAKLIVYEVDNTETGGNQIIGTSPPGFTYDDIGTQKEKIVVHANGNETVVYEKLINNINGVANEPCWQLFGPLVCNPDCNIPAGPDYNVSASMDYNDKIDPPTYPT